MKKHLAGKLIIIIIFISAGVLAAQEIVPPERVERPTVGLALGGGGARGIAHIGILKALEEEGIPIDYIAGTSMGSIIGGLYVSGYSSSDQVRIIKEIDWENIFNELPEKTVQLTGSRYGIMAPLIRLRFKFWKIYIPVGLNNGQKISNTLFRYTSAASFTAKSDFNNLKIPFRAVAVDTKTGEAAELGKGELSRAIRASMAIPLVFNPAYFDGRLFIDGGVVNNLPTNVVKKMGADIIIACDVDMLNPLSNEPTNIADIAKHTLDITTMALKKVNVELADIYIQPDLGSHSIFDYSDFDTLIESGYKAAMSKMDEIKAAIHWEKPVKSELWISTISDKVTVKSINVMGLSKVRKPVVIQEFSLSEGDQYDPDKAEEGILKVYSTDLFENVWLELENTGNNKVVINIHVIEKYPRTIGVGLNFNETEGPGGFAQIIHYNLLGWGERFMPFIRYSELHKRAGLEIVNDRYMGTPLTLNNGFFIERDEPYVYANGKQIGQIQTDRFVIKISAGIHPYRKLLIMAGTRAEYIKTSENRLMGITEETLKNIDFFAKILWDTTDHDYFPHRGTLVKINTELIEDIKFHSIPNLKNETLWNSYLPIGNNNTIKISLKTKNSLLSLPMYDQYKIGGSEVLPGYYRDELAGNNIYSAGISHRIKFLKRFYITTGISAGLLDNNFSFDKITGGIYTELSIDTPAGPAKIGYGINSEQTGRAYISMGYNF